MGSKKRLSTKSVPTCGKPSRFDNFLLQQLPLITQSNFNNMYKTRKLGPRKRIAMVAHDNKKKDLIDWAEFNKTVLARHELLATGTTGRLLEETLRPPGEEITKWTNWR